MSLSTLQLLSQARGGMDVELTSQSAQQWPSHFSIINSRIFDSISKFASGRGAVVPPKYATGKVASDVFGGVIAKVTIKFTPRRVSTLARITGNRISAWCIGEFLRLFFFADLCSDL
jgi:hypothetical protein